MSTTEVRAKIRSWGHILHGSIPTGRLLNGAPVAIVETVAGPADRASFHYQELAQDVPSQVLLEANVLGAAPILPRARTIAVHDDPAHSIGFMASSTANPTPCFDF